MSVETVLLFGWFVTVGLLEARINKLTRRIEQLELESTFGAKPIQPRGKSPADYTFGKRG